MRNQKQYLLAIDFGTGAGRCYLVSTDGESSFEQYQEWEYEYPQEAQPGGSEFNAKKFWGILASLVQKTIHNSGVSPENIIGVSSTSQREGVVFLDRQGKDLYAGPNLDMRFPTEIDAFEQKFAEKIHLSSGHWPFPMFLPYRLEWFKEKRPAVFEKIDKVVLLNNWILFRLCGAAAAEPSNGIETALMDLRSRSWNTELITEIGYDLSIFPPVNESGTVIGHVTEEASKQTGLLTGTPVVLGGADSQCAMLGTAAINTSDIGVVLGTYGPLQMVVSQPTFAPPELIWSGCHVAPEYWVIESTSMEAGQAFRWIRDIFYGGEKKEIYQLMSREAALSPIGANEIRAYIGPRLPNYKKLEFDCSGGFTFRLPPAPGRVNRGDFSRAVIESVGFGVKLNADRLSRIAGQKINTLKVCGGLSKNALVIEVLSNLMEVEVSVPVQKEGSAVGAAICAGVGAGCYANMADGANKMIKWERIQSPESQLSDRYQQIFFSWMEKYHAMYGERTLQE